MTESKRMVAPPIMLKELRQLVASAISDVKAYDVPALCRRLGLANGSEQEAFASKFKYAQKRLADIDATRVLEVARALLTEHPHYALSEQLAKLDEVGGEAITSLTRRRLMTLFDARPLCTEIEEIELIRGLWPIASMPPHYEGRASLEDDIIKHTIANDDWSQKDLLEALGLMTCSRAQLFRFLEAVTAPDAQTSDAQKVLVEEINKHLVNDGYVLTIAGKISGSPRYAVCLASVGAPSNASISSMLAAFEPTLVHARWQQALERRASDPEGAITVARTLLEDVCKWILEEAGEVWREADDLPVLYRKLSKVLKLAPDDHTEQVFKQILGSCQSVVESLAALRNKLSDAHSPGPKRARPLARHAELAVNLSGAMATFLVATWQARKTEAKSARPRS